MPRFILIDNVSGYIFGDTADLPPVTLPGETEPTDASYLTPERAARWLDTAVIGEHGRSYETVNQLASNETGYLVYRADVDGSEAMPVGYDGQDRETIDAVQASCQHVATVRAYTPA